jgi:UDPglucose--hexose-1-phosphate uridylyltransferase
MSSLRRDPITRRLVIIAPERSPVLARSLRPIGRPADAHHDDLCPFCPGNEALAGRELLAWRPPGAHHDGADWRVRVVANRLPALRVESDLGHPPDALFESFGGLGAHEVIIESPRHDASLQTMSDEEIALVLWAWRERMRDLRRDFRLRSFHIVKNIGMEAGATMAHAHSQLLALPLVPEHLEDELLGAKVHYERTGRCIFCDLAAEETANAQRLVSRAGGALAFVPFAARVPFETWIVLEEHQHAFESTGDAGLAAAAAALGDVMRRLEAALESPSATILLHTAPAEVSAHASFHWHLEVIPRLVPVTGLAWDGGVHINPVLPEEAAEVLRGVSDTIRPDGSKASAGGGRA